MLSGQKGLGKSTLINHLLFYIFDKNNYDVKNYNFDNKSSFYNQFLSNILNIRLQYFFFFKIYITYFSLDSIYSKKRSR